MVLVVLALYGLWVIGGMVLTIRVWRREASVKLADLITIFIVCVALGPILVAWMKLDDTGLFRVTIFERHDYD